MTAMMGTYQTVENLSYSGHIDIFQDADINGSRKKTIKVIDAGKKLRFPDPGTLLQTIIGRCGQSIAGLFHGLVTGV